MWLLNDSIKRTLNKVDAAMNDEVFGYVVIEEDNTVALYDADTDKFVMELNERHEIRIINGNEQIPVTVDDVLNKKCRHGFPLYPGRECFVNETV